MMQTEKGDISWAWTVTCRLERVNRSIGYTEIVRSTYRRSTHAMRRVGNYAGDWEKRQELTGPAPAA